MFFVIFLATTFMTALAPFLGSPQKVSAAGERYVYYYPNDPELIDQLQEAFESGRSIDQLKQTSVWSKGGVWGEQPLRMSFDSVAGGVYASKVLRYSATYKCDGGNPVRGNDTPLSLNDGYFEITVSRLIDLHKAVENGNKFFDQSAFVASKTGVSKITKYGKAPPASAPGSGSTGSRQSSFVEASFNDAEPGLSVDKIKENNFMNAAQMSGCIPSFAGHHTSFGQAGPPDTPNYWKPTPREAEWPNLVTADASRRSGSSTASSEDAQPNCITSGDNLAIFICPWIDGMASASDFVFNRLDSMLDDVPIGLAPDDPGFKAWQVFRLMGNIVLVGALLAMVFAQTFGGRFIDAYTLRKMAPRVLIGAILINLSIYFCIAAADATKVIGKGFGQLMTQPFLGDAQNFDFSIGSGAAGVIGLAGSGVVAGFIALVAKGFVSGATVSMWVFLFILLPVVILSLLILLVAIARQGLLIFLIVVAPIAFALYVLPSTEKYFKKWWSWFVKTLAVYIVIVVAFVMSDILVYLIASGPGGSEPGAEEIAAIMGVMFAPMAMVPFAWQIAGGPAAQMLSGTLGAVGKFNPAGKAQQAYGKARQNNDNYFTKRSRAAAGNRSERGLSVGGQLASLGAARKGYSRARAEGKDRAGATLAGYEAKRGELQRAASDHIFHEIQQQMEKSGYAHALDDDTGKMAVAYAQAKEHGASEAQAQAAAAEAGRVAARGRNLDRALNLADAGDVDWLADQLVAAQETAESEGRDFDASKWQSDFLTKFNGAPEIGARRAALNSNMGLVNQLAGGVDNHVLEGMGLMAIAKTTTGEANAAKMTERVAHAAHGDQNLMARLLNETKKQQGQVGMVGFSGSSFPTHFEVAASMMNDMAAGKAIDHKGYAQTLYRSVRKKQQPYTLVTMDNRSFKEMAESGVFTDDIMQLKTNLSTIKDAADRDAVIAPVKTTMETRQKEVETAMTEVQKAQNAGDKTASDAAELRLRDAQRLHSEAYNEYQVKLQGYTYTDPTGRSFSYAEADKQYQSEAAKLAAMYDSMGNMARNNQNDLRNTLTARHLPAAPGSAPGTLGATIAEELTDLRSNPVYRYFHQERREWVSNIEADHAAALAAAAGGPGGPPSDRRLKTDISHVATTSTGIKLYRFRYVWGGDYQVGVMAQDIFPSNPEAVTQNEFGYLSVNYTKLGLQMITWEEWLAGKNVSTSPSVIVTHNTHKETV